MYQKNAIKERNDELCFGEFEQWASFDANIMTVELDETDFNEWWGLSEVNTLDEEMYTSLEALLASL